MPNLEDDHYLWRYAKPTQDPEDPTKALEPLTDEAFLEETGLTPDDAQALICGDGNTRIANALWHTLDVDGTAEFRLMAMCVHLCARVRQLELEMAGLRFEVLG